MDISVRRAGIAIAAASFAGILVGVALRILTASDGWYYASVLGISGLAVLRTIAPDVGIVRPRRFVPARKDRAVTDPTVAAETSARAGEPTPSASSSQVSQLWVDYKRHHSDRAREQLVVAYSPLVKYVAGRMSSGLPAQVEESDVFSYGLMGLISAIERFDIEREIRFETYAITCIKGAIIDELRAIDWVPRSVRMRAREIERAHYKLERRLQRTPTDDEMARELNITVEEFRESLATISNSTVVALDELWAVPDASSPEVALLDKLHEPYAPHQQRLLDATEVKDRLADAISALPGREKLVIALYYYESLTLREIGEVLGVNEARIAELHSRAMLNLGRDLSSRVLEDAYEVSRDHSPEATQRRPWLAAAGSI